jgi:hypothetical protein
VRKELSHAEQRDKERKRKLLAKQGIKMAEPDEDDEADAGLC